MNDRARLILRVISAFVAAAAAAVYLDILLENNCHFAAGPDSSGYLNAARLFAAGQLREEVRALHDWKLPDSMVYLFTPVGFASQEPGTMVPAYPAGVPLHMILAARVGGWSRAPFLVSPLLAMGALVLIVLMSRQLGLSWGWGVAAALIVALFPSFLHHALQPVSDVPATFWALLTLSCALRAHRWAGWAYLAGAALGMGVWVRPTNVLMALPLLMALRADAALLARAVAGTAPFALTLSWLQLELYGKPWITGYGPVPGLIGPEGLSSCWKLFMGTGSAWLTPLVMPGGMLVAFDRSQPRWRRAMLVTWFATFFCFYLFYQFCHETWALRMLLPALPALTIGLLLVLRDIVRGEHLLVRGAAVAMVACVIWQQLPHIEQQRVLHVDEHDSVYPEGVAWAESLVPADALVFTGVLSGAYRYHSRRTVLRWDQLLGERVAVLRASPAGERPWYALLSDAEALSSDPGAVVPGRWSRLGRMRDLTLWKLERDGLSRSE